MITIVRGKRGLVAIYAGNDLAATMDKYCRPDDIELAIKQHGGGKVKETTGDFSSLAEIPLTLSKPRSAPKTEPVIETDAES